MSFILNILRRGKKEPSDLQKAVMANIITSDAGRTASEREDAALLGINLNMIQDEGLTKWLDRLSVIKTDGHDGNPGEAIVDLNMLALRFMCSSLIRTSYVEPIDAEIAMMETEQFVNRIELQLPEDSYEFGGSNLLEAICAVIKTSWADAVNGRKAKLLKVSPRVFEVNLPEQQKKGQQQRSWMS